MRYARRAGPTVGRGLLCAMGLAGLGCTSTEPGASFTKLQGLPRLVLSEPLVPETGDGEAVAFASLPPEAVAGGDSLVIATRAGAALASAPLIEGGFDPVPVPSAVGDTLVLRLYRHGAGQALVVEAEVPKDRPPVIVRTEPPPSKPDVPLNASLRVVFSEPIQAATLTPASIQLRRGVVPIPGTVSFADAEHVVVRFTPEAPLAPSTAYTLVVSGGITDLAGEAVRPATIPFRTLPAGVPGAVNLAGIIASDLEQSATGPSVAWLSARPGTAPAADSVEIVYGGAVRFRVAGGGFDPVPFPARVGQQIELNWYLNGKPRPYRHFVAIPEAAPPVVVRTTPLAGATGVAPAAGVEVVFSEVPREASVTPATVQLRTGGVTVPAVVAVTGGQRLTASLTPLAPLAVGTRYDLLVTAGVEDLTGTSLQPVTVSFTTAGPSNFRMPAGVLARDSTAGGGFWAASRIALAPDGSLRLTLEGPPGILAYEGWATPVDSQTLAIAFPKGAASWQAQAVVRGDTLDLTFGAAMQAAGFTDATYRPRPGDSVPAPDPDAPPQVYETPPPAAGTFLRRLILAPGGQARLELNEWNNGLGITGGVWVPRLGGLTWETGFFGGSGLVRADTLFLSPGTTGGGPGSVDTLFLVPPGTTPLPSGRLAFTSTRDGAPAVFVANPDGSGVTRLADGERPAWSWSGAAIAYTRRGTGSAPDEIHVMQADGSGDRVVATGRAPAWSPDDASLIYTLADTVLMRVSLDGSPPTRVLGLDAPGLPVGADALGEPSWSPDGTQLAFTASVPSPYGYVRAGRVMIADAAGGVLRRLRADTVEAYAPTWLGTRPGVSAGSWRVDDNVGFYWPEAALVDPATGASTPLYGADGAWTIHAVAPSAGDRWFAIDQEDYEGRRRLILLDAATGRVTGLVPDARTPALGGYSDRDPAWTRQ